MDASAPPRVDATASPRVDAESEVYGFFLEIDNSSYSTPYKHKNSVIKYTKLPDFDFDSRGNVVLCCVILLCVDMLFNTFSFY